MSDADTTDWLGIIRGEYVEMPGLQLTESQAARLWGIDEHTCQAILTTLVNENFLSKLPDGRYTRASSSRVSEAAAGS